jgi:hypothetical protein
MCDRREGFVLKLEMLNAFLTRIPCPARLIMVSAVKSFSEPGSLSLTTVLATLLGIMKLYAFFFSLPTVKNVSNLDAVYLRLKAESKFH